MWSNRDIVVVRGRMRIRRRGDVVEDTRMLLAVRRPRGGADARRVVARPRALLRDRAAQADPVVAREAFIALHRDAQLEP